MLHKGLAVLAMLACLTGCDATANNYECTVERVEGTFVTSRLRIKTNRRLVTLFRYEDGKKRTFMFPAELIQCEKTQ